MRTTRTAVDTPRSGHGRRRHARGTIHGRHPPTIVLTGLPSSVRPRLTETSRPDRPSVLRAPAVDWRHPLFRRGTPMRYRTLGSSDLQVSEISLGSWLTFSGGIEEEATRATTEAAFDVGINFFDTANVYGRGAAEAAWGDILSQRPARQLHPRDQGVGPHVGHGRRPVGRADRQADRRLAQRASAPTTSTCTRRIGSTCRCRSRRPSRRCRRWWSRARPATSASANGRPSRSRPRSTSPGPTCSSRRNRSTPCCGRRPRSRSSR